MDKKRDLLDMDFEELLEALTALGFPAFRAKQVYQWLYSGQLDFGSMTNLPKDMRAKLAEEFAAGRLKIADKLISKVDGTRKYLFELEDGNIIESVLMKYRYGYSACLSTQVGCRMGCTFCASASLGLVRNLTVGELLAQVLNIIHDIGERVSHLVLMGIGEPFDNYDNVMTFLRRVSREDTLNISYRKMTVSTCGIVPKILEFAKEGIPVNLSVSLHAPDDEIRKRTMPVARRWSFNELLYACNEYTRLTSRRITYEYSLIENVNDSVEFAEILAKKLKGTLCHVNLIPVNTVEGIDFNKSSRNRTDAFKKMLEKYGIAVTVRRELGSDIMAACGQLRRNTLTRSGKV
ncbi:MAG: 23S rRNA (adenine(2503)-C(2))-methyltransferase RlmN [Clostridiaceae bacterium]|jgi:23S rRNA (adenine2503-C2)-methyltransferase|nr:23S rRNA (adenine(2503)-C(2))-methyltransferase RlmN [Clostridiaceae bacterium]